MNKIFRVWLALSIVVLVGCASSPPPAVGTWSIDIASPAGDLPATLTLNADGSGMVNADLLGETAFTGATYDGNTVSVLINIDAQGMELALDFTGTIEGDSVEGSFDSPFGPLSVSGSRQ
jgi:hypothetical protein